MLCCPNCFNDVGLRNEIIPQWSDRAGNCPNCGSDNQPLVEAAKLSDYFELLMGIYVPSDEGRPIIDILQEDWALFSNGNISDAKAKEILAEVLDDGEIVRRAFVISDRCRSDSLEKWKKLRSELMDSNRFFPGTDLDTDRLVFLLSNLELGYDEWQAGWYRSRIETDGTPYPLDQMGAPPKRLASSGRANPVGIPYLYLASSVETAIAEVRPHPGERVTVATFNIPDLRRVIDLRNPRARISPFLLEDEDQIAAMRGDVNFLEILGNELSTPVAPADSMISYVPSQYLCEFIKKCGYEGVAYKSSVSDGMNLAMFDCDIAAASSVEEFTLTSLSFEYSPV